MFSTLHNRFFLALAFLGLSSCDLPKPPSSNKDLFKIGEISPARVYKRPWGDYINLEKQVNYLLKMLIINPGEKTSLQSHNHRSERWFVVEGTPTIFLGKDRNHLKEFEAKEGETVFVDVKALHRIINKTDKPVYLFEKQIRVPGGAPLSEEDIIRYDDQYGRTG